MTRCSVLRNEWWSRKGADTKESYHPILQDKDKPHDSTGFPLPLWHQSFHTALVWLLTNLWWQSQSRNPTLWMKNSKLIIQIYCDVCVGVQLVFFFSENEGMNNFAFHKTLYLFYLRAHDNLSPNLIGKHNPFRERNENHLKWSCLNIPMVKCVADLMGLKIKKEFYYCYC